MSQHNQVYLEVDTYLFDGAAVIPMLSPTSKGANTFTDYAASIFIPYILRQLGKVTRLGVVWHRYIMSG